MTDILHPGDAPEAITTVDVTPFEEGRVIVIEEKVAYTDEEGEERDAVIWEHYLPKSMAEQLHFLLGKVLGK